jgi:hypothetical protein
MSELLRWETNDGPVVIEVDSKDAGFRSVARKTGEVIDVDERFEGALEKVRGAATSALATFRDSSLKPDEVELEFGIKFSVTAGAMIAKTAVEGNLIVRLKWASEQATKSPE